MNNSEITYRVGLSERYRNSAADLYDEAFGEKFSRAISNRDKRISVLTRGVTLDYTIVAIADDRLVGLAGFHTAAGSLTSGITFASLISQLGFVPAMWAAMIFSLYERKPKAGELLMDGIAVNAKYRGHGIGTRLLDEIEKYAIKTGFKHIRLDVIDTNSGARRLYERRGFVAAGTEHFPYLRWLLGFGGSTTMKLALPDDG